MLEKLKPLMDGEAAVQLRAIEDRIKVFCPFEAIGMVHQEIRHSNFLAYILDPKRPHGLGSQMLEALITEMRSKAPAHWPQNLMSEQRLQQAIVERERMNIDLLIEIPGRRNQRGLVIAIEVKVYAAEGSAQLSGYEKKLESAYPTSHWDHCLAFLTLDGRQARTAEKNDWQAISFDDLFHYLNAQILTAQLKGPAVDLFRDYEKMMRRHGMAENKNHELDQAVKQLWSDHREALDFLISRRPAPVQDLIRELDKAPDRFASILSEKLGHGTCVDSNYARWRRISIPYILDITPQMRSGDTGWVRSGAMAVLELNPEGDQIYASLAINHTSTAPEFKAKLLDALHAATGTKLTAGVNHFWYQKLFNADDILNEVENCTDPLEYLAETLAIRFRGNLATLIDCIDQSKSD